MTTTTSMVPGRFIAKVSEVPSGSSFNFEYKGGKAVLLNINGNYIAYVNKCTHLGCALALKGGIFRCPCHNSQFDPLTGEVLKGPARKPLTSIDVFTREGGIYIRS